MSARFENNRRFRAELPKLVAAMAGALRDIGAKTIEWSTDRRQVSARIGANIWSWGEHLTASTDETGAVQVNSVCSFPIQIFDWGKNAENCRKFLECVESRLDSDVLA